MSLESDACAARDACVNDMLKRLTREGHSPEQILYAIRDAFEAGALWGHATATRTVRSFVETKVENEVSS